MRTYTQAEPYDPFEIAAEVRAQRIAHRDEFRARFDEANAKRLEGRTPPEHTKLAAFTRKMKTKRAVERLVRKEG